MMFHQLSGHPLVQPSWHTKLTITQAWGLLQWPSTLLLWCESSRRQQRQKWVKCYLQDQTESQIWPSGSSLLTPSLGQHLVITWHPLSVAHYRKTIKCMLKGPIPKPGADEEMCIGSEPGRMRGAAGAGMGMTKAQGRTRWARRRAGSLCHASEPWTRRPLPPRPWQTLALTGQERRYEHCGVCCLCSILAVSLDKSLPSLSPTVNWAVCTMPSPKPADGPWAPGEISHIEPTYEDCQGLKSDPRWASALQCPHCPLPFPSRERCEHFCNEHGLPVLAQRGWSLVSDTPYKGPETSLHEENENKPGSWP